MNRIACLAAVVAPALGLAALWGLSDHTYRQGTEWEVPIQGYDPRDYLRGHYIEFSYDWPGIGELRDPVPAVLCLEGAAPNIARVTATDDGSCTHPIRAGATGAYGRDGLTRGQLYLGQSRADALQQELQDRDQRGIVTIRQRDDGSFTPIAIRFRPLTAEERTERDAQNERRAGELLPPPAIMSE